MREIGRSRVDYAVVSSGLPHLLPCRVGRGWDSLAVVAPEEFDPSEWISPPRAVSVSKGDSAYRLAMPFRNTYSPDSAANCAGLGVCHPGTSMSVTAGLTNATRLERTQCMTFPHEHESWAENSNDYANCQYISNSGRGQVVPTESERRIDSVWSHSHVDCADT
jgi:hypothetical protein